MRIKLVQKNFKRQLDAIANADKALAKLEAQQIDLTNKAMQQAMTNLLAELRRKVGDRQGTDLLGRDRAILLANDLRDSLNVFSPADPRTKALLKDFKKLIADSDQIGQRLGEEQIRANGPTIATTADLSLDVVTAVAQAGHDRLLSRGTEFANNATTAIQQGVLQGWGYPKIATALRSIATVTRAKAEQIVRTEVSRASISAVKARYATDGITKGIWIATQDGRVCKRCAARAGEIYLLDKIVMPLHPSDRCYLSPWKKEWADAGLIDDEWRAQHQADCIAKAGGADRTPSPWERTAPKAEAKPKAEARPATEPNAKAEPQKSNADRVAEAHPQYSKMERSIIVNTLDQIDERAKVKKEIPGDSDYKKALLTPLRNLAIDGQESSLDRMFMIHRDAEKVYKNKEIPENAVKDLASHFGQALRGYEETTRANVAYTKYIYDNLDIQGKQLWLEGARQYLGDGGKTFENSYFDTGRKVDPAFLDRLNRDYEIYTRKVESAARANSASNNNNNDVPDLFGDL